MVTYGDLPLEIKMEIMILAPEIIEPLSKIDTEIYDLIYGSRLPGEDYSTYLRTLIRNTTKYIDTSLFKGSIVLNNLRHGEWKIYDGAGELQEILNYKLGLLDGLVTLNTTDNRISTFTYKEGLLNGPASFVKLDFNITTDYITYTGEFENGTYVGKWLKQTTFAEHHKEEIFFYNDGSMKGLKEYSETYGFYDIDIIKTHINPLYEYKDIGITKSGLYTALFIYDDIIKVEYDIEENISIVTNPSQVVRINKSNTGFNIHIPKFGKLSFINSKLHYIKMQKAIIQFEHDRLIENFITEDHHITTFFAHDTIIYRITNKFSNDHIADIILNKENEMLQECIMHNIGKIYVNSDGTYTITTRLSIVKFRENSFYTDNIELSSRIDISTDEINILIDSNKNIASLYMIMDTKLNLISHDLSKDGINESHSTFIDGNIHTLIRHANNTIYEYTYSLDTGLIISKNII